MKKRLDQYRLLVLSLLSEGWYLRAQGYGRKTWRYTRRPVSETPPYDSRGEPDDNGVLCPVSIVRTLLDRKWVQEEDYEGGSRITILPHAFLTLGKLYPASGLWDTVRAHQEDGVGEIARLPRLPDEMRDLRSMRSGEQLDKVLRAIGYPDDEPSPSTAPGALARHLGPMVKERVEGAFPAVWGFETEDVRVAGDGPVVGAVAKVELGTHLTHWALGSSPEEALARGVASGQLWWRSRQEWSERPAHREPRVVQPVTTGTATAVQRPVEGMEFDFDHEAYRQWPVYVAHSLLASMDDGARRTKLGRLAGDVLKEIYDSVFEPGSHRLERPTEDHCTRYPDELGLTAIREMCLEAGLIEAATKRRFERTEKGGRAVESAAYLAWALGPGLLHGKHDTRLDTLAAIRPLILGRLLEQGELMITELAATPEVARQIPQDYWDKSGEDARFWRERGVGSEVRYLKADGLAVVDGRRIRPSETLKTIATVRRE